jgi:serine phosphatase RsbU (regulator of sigma subunit)
MIIDSAEAGLLRLVPRAGTALTATDRSLLRDGAERAALSIRRALLHEHEHWIAVELQRGLLPKRLPDVSGVEIAVHYEVAGLGAEAGGDWYDAFALSSGQIGLVVGDVTGKGIPAASAMGQLRSAARAFALADDGGRSPGEVLTRLNRHQLALGQQELFTIVYAIVDPAARTVSWACAGHPPPLLRPALGEMRYLEGAAELMGMDDVEYQSREAQIAGGGTLVLYSDGLIERRGESLDAGLERLARAARTGPDEPQALCEHIRRRALPQATQRPDDVTLVVARIA